MDGWMVTISQVHAGAKSMGRIWAGYGSMSTRLFRNFKINETLIGNLIVSETKSTQQIELMWKYYYYLCAYLIITISYLSN
jgi:hypothetical protein